jgi:hypothetical protein
MDAKLLVRFSLFHSIAFNDNDFSRKPRVAIGQFDQLAIGPHPPHTGDHTLTQPQRERTRISFLSMW